jgi:hypothetical protein
MNDDRAIDPRERDPWSTSVCSHAAAHGLLRLAEELDIPVGIHMGGLPAWEVT